MTWLQEQVKSDGALVVNRDAGVIHNVRILGLTSANGRTYTTGAVKRALSHYEGVSVNVDHPLRAGEPVSVPRRFGWLERVRVAADGGLRGDLHYLKSHPCAAQVCEAAERNPRLFGLSHNVSGKVRRQDGGEVVEEIEVVHSVDLVADPATVAGLHEGRSGRAGEQGLTPARLREAREFWDDVYQRTTGRDRDPIPGSPAALSAWLRESDGAGGGRTYDRWAEERARLQQVKEQLARRRLGARQTRLLEMAEAGIIAGDTGSAASGIMSGGAAPRTDVDPDAEVVEVLKRKLRDLISGNESLPLKELVDRVKALLDAAAKGDNQLLREPARESRFAAPSFPPRTAGALLEQRPPHYDDSPIPTDPRDLARWLKTQD